ncbi:hypothetical protein SDC9_172170 [bioreactor metagenome]|uniref:Uncharacterized protein n=1 Tax=bioreactor metagenome TaxID=1076179 RepID=A0A645GCY9_9ZZZZ
MPLVAGVVAVRLAGRVEMPLGRSGIRRAAIAGLMNVKTMLSRRQAGNLRLDPQTAVQFGQRHLAAHRTSRTGLQIGAGHRPRRRRGAGAQQACRNGAHEKTGTHGHLYLLFVIDETSPLVG